MDYISEKMWISNGLYAQGLTGLNEGVHQHTTECDVQAVTLEMQEALGHQEEEINVIWKGGG